MKIAITGGIGAGKSYVCRALEQQGIRVYDCDAAAKRLMRNDKALQQALRELAGQEVYDAEGNLQKAVLAQFLLQSETNKQAVNDVVHPAVARDFEQSGLSWLESAILFESRFDKRTRFDRVVCVTAPEQVRLQRIMARDGITAEKARAWISAQMPQEEMRRRSNYEIVNDGQQDVTEQVDRLLEKLSEK